MLYRIQKELDELQSSNLEDQCQKLQHEVKSLQQQLRQCHIKQQQQQRELQQQLQNQSVKLPVTTEAGQVPKSEQVCCTHYNYYIMI